MKAAIGCLIGLVFVVSASAEPLLEGRVRLDSGEPVADAQVRLFDLTDLRQGAIARAMTDGTGYFALPLAALGGRALPERFALGPNYPNPFNPSTIIPYQLAASSQVRLEVFNLLGQHLATLVDGERPAGFHTATWHATDAAGRAVGAGVYIYRMTVGVESQTGRMVLIDGQAGVSAGGAASVWSDGADAQVYGLVVSGSGLVPYVDSSFRVEGGMASVELVVSAGSPSAGKATDDDCPLCDFLGAFNDQQEEEADETEEEEAETDSTASEGGADLIVQSPSVNDSTLTPGQEFTLNVTVHNQGDEQAAATMLHYYRSNNSTITASDTEVGTDAIDALDAAATSAQSIALTAPTGGGSGVYYGACVASVSGESNTDNNCSSAVRITVSGQETTEEEEDDGAEEESSEPGEGDLIVSASVNDNILTPGQAFILRAAVQNQGADEFPDLVLSYYRSPNSTISTQDTQVGTDDVGSLAASSIKNEPISLTAPSTPGTYYYGACVASVSDESDTPNNCSTGVSVIVEEQDEDLVSAEPGIYNDNIFVLSISEDLAVDWASFAVEDYTRRFYDHFEDEFDFLLVGRNLTYGVDFDSAPSGVFYSVSNNVQGIGVGLFSNAQNWGSSGKLQGVAFFPYVNVINSRWAPIGRGPGIHELLHRWANFVVPSSDASHWGFSSANGLLGGFDITSLVDHGGNKYSAGEFWPNGNHGRPFSPIELYLAGFIPPEEVPDLWVAEDGQWVLDSEGEILLASDGDRVFTASRITTYTIEDIIAEHGPRVPDASQSQRDFRAAVILLTDEKHPPNRRVLERLSEDISWTSHAAFTEEGDDRFGNSIRKTNFYESTGGRATITMDDLSHFQSSASAKRLVPSSFGTPPPPIVDHCE